MSNAADQFTKNKFVDKCLSLIPNDPLIQARYMYYLTSIVFLGLLGYGLASWYYFFTGWEIKQLFSGLFMTAVAIMSLFGLKQTRATYLAIKEMYSNKPKEQVAIESPKEMLQSFNEKV